ncbi:MAG TPA: hypothetical protein VG408_02020 [Actinomycetota bacterium]|nr:hypothetical protein [Actinomycetota bacterium]
MKKAIALAAVLVLFSAGVAGSAEIFKTPEGCVAANPAQPTCTYKTTEDVATFGGAAGAGSWSVTVQVGKKITSYKSPASGEPSGTQFLIPSGATVTAKALTPGSGVIVGGE